MAKSVLGVDIGHDSLKLALVNGRQVKKAVIVPLPQNLVREGRAVSTETMGELLRKAMRDNGIHCSRGAVALANETVYVRNVSMPVMSDDQLLYNIPFEFRDYITDEMKNYVFDYAMISTPTDIASQKAASQEETSEQGSSMELMAVAAPVTLLEDTKAILRKAGLKLVKAAPALCAYLSLIRRLEQGGANPGNEYCVLDFGYQAIRMYMFRGDVHVVTRVLEVGMSSLDDVIAEHYNVDVHLAHTYLMTNYDGCQEQEFCQNAYNNISVELMRALNFYRFSNPDSHLNDVWLCGGGAAIPALCRSVAETLDMQIHSAQELLQGQNLADDTNSLVQAVGICFD